MRTQRVVSSGVVHRLARALGGLVRQPGLAPLVLALGALAAVAAACSAPAPAAPQLVKITVLTSTGISSQQIAVGMEKGIFQAEGIEFDRKAFTSGADAAEAFRAGNGDILESGEVPGMRVWTVYEDSVGIAQSSWRDDLSVIGGPGIKSASDLKGKKVGTTTGSTNDFFLQLYLARNNVRPQDLTILNLPAADLVAALEKGDLAAFSYNQPFGWRALEITKGATVLAAGKDYKAWNTMVFTARRSWLEKNREAAKKLLVAMDKANKEIMAPGNREWAVDFVAKQLKATPTDSKRLMELMNWELTFDTRFKDYLNSVAEFMVGQKTLTRPLNWSKDFDTSVVKAVDPNLVKAQ